LSHPHANPLQKRTQGHCITDYKYQVAVTCKYREKQLKYLLLIANTLAKV
jgi:hypothetical protein